MMVKEATHQDGISFRISSLLSEIGVHDLKENEMGLLDELKVFVRRQFEDPVNDSNDDGSLVKFMSCCKAMCISCLLWPIRTFGHLTCPIAVSPCRIFFARGAPKKWSETKRSLRG